MEIRYTATALHQLAGILDYIANDDHEAACKVSHAVERAVELVAFMPKLGRPVPKRTGTLTVLARPYPYRLTYRVSGQKLEVLAIVHTARELAN